MAIRRAANRGSPEAQGAKIMMDNSRRIQASEMKTLAEAKKRAKR